MPGKQKKGSNKRADRDLLNNKAPSKSSARQAQEAAAAAAAAREQQQQQAKSAAPSAEELASQQKLLSIFQSAYSEVLSSPDFSSTLQEVKAALYEREFERAFAKEEYLDVYAARWSPTRALGYAAVLEGLREWLNGLLLEEDGATAWGTPATAAVEAEVNEETAERMGDLSLGDESTKTGDSEDAEAAAVPESKEHQDGNDEDEEATDSEQQDTTTTTTTTHKTLKVLALGGGTAELAALVSFLSKSSLGVRGDLTLVDAGPWAGPVAKLHTALTVPPPIYKYASAAAKAAKAANKALADATTLRYDFLHRDALSLTAAELRDCVVPRDHQPVLVTLLFTLNELYTGGGIGKTTAFLRMLGRTLAPGSLLLVVDSPGSYSEAAVGGKEKKKYPMSWLVDHTLLRAGDGGSGQAARRKPQDQEGGAGADAGEEKSDKTPAQQEEGCKWEKLEENESIWFRISDELRYPIQLENMRYQLHLYRAISATETKK